MSLKTVSVNDYSNIPNEALVPHYQSMVKKGFGNDDKDIWIWNVFRLVEEIKERNLVTGIVAEDMRSRAVTVFENKGTVIALKSPIPEIDKFLNSIDKYDDDEIEEKGLLSCDKLIEWIAFSPPEKHFEARELFHRVLDAIKHTIPSEGYDREISRLNQVVCLNSQSEEN